jgi:hypothetical protein
MKSKIQTIKNNFKYVVSKPSTLVLISFCLIAFASCRKKSIIPVAGRGEIVSQTYDRSNFDHVDLSIDADVDYIQDKTYFVEVYAQSNIQKALQITVDGSTLRIDSKNPLWKHKTVRIKVHSPNLYGVEVSGSGDFTAQTPILTNTMDIDISGSGSVSLASVKAQNLNAELSGSGKLTIQGGSTVDQSLKASGSGDFDVISMSSENATVRLSGSGSAKLNVTKRLDVSISGSGSVKYTGTPAINSDASGSGKLISIN